MKSNKVLIFSSILFGFLLIITIFAWVTYAEKPDDNTLILLGGFETCESLGFSPDGVTYSPKKSRLFISASGEDVCTGQRGVFEVTLDGEVKKMIYIPWNFGFSITRVTSGPKVGHFFLVDYNSTPTVRVLEYDKDWEKVNEFIFTGASNPGDGIAFNHITQNLAICDGCRGVFEITTSGDLVNFFPISFCLAGMTFNIETGTYFGLGHSPPTLYEFTTSGEIKRIFDLSEYGVMQAVGIGSGQGKLFIADEIDSPNVGGYIWIFKSPHRVK